MLGTEPKIIESYVNTGLIRFQFRHQLNYGKVSELASQAAECAGEQKQFFEMRDALFANQAKAVTPGDPALLKALAQALLTKRFWNLHHSFNNLSKFFARVNKGSTTKSGLEWKGCFLINPVRRWISVQPAIKQSSWVCFSALNRA